MDSAAPQPVDDLHLENGFRVSGLLERPANARALFVMAHGAGAGMRHAFLSQASAALAERGIASLRYQFPYMEENGGRPDPPALCHATVRAAVAWAGKLQPALPLIAGGKSFGGRMTSQAQAAEPLPGVRGIAFLGFPLHPPKKPSLARADHLSEVHLPMLFLQGTRDALADMQLTRLTVERLGNRASLIPIDGADHAFHVLARSGRTDAEVLRQIADALGAWIDSIVR
ncbi:MAG: alpha/beta family hydrolase [Steroidobacteraceae bacterium]